MYSLVVLKPDAVARQLIGPLISEITAQWGIKAMNLRTLNDYEIINLYDQHRAAHYWPRLHAAMLSGPSVPIVVHDPECTVGEIRAWALDARDRYMVNPHNPAFNVVHATDEASSAYREIDIFFPGIQL